MDPQNKKGFNNYEYTDESAFSFKKKPLTNDDNTFENKQLNANSDFFSD